MANTAKNSAAVENPAAKKQSRAAKPKKRESATSEVMNQAAAELIRMAEEGGVEQNYFFTTSFERYKMQLRMLERLKEEIDSGEMLVTKEYVKGRANLMENPAVASYNKTSLAANQTVVTLMRIIKTFAAGPVLGGKKKAEEDEDIDL